MMARIVPRPKRGSKPLKLPSTPQAETLAYAVEKKIYVLSDPESRRSVQIAERSDWVVALALHEGRLIDAGGYAQILDTETDALIRSRLGPVNALTVHEGKLVDAAGTLISYTASDEPIRTRPYCVRALAVYGGELVDAGSYDQILYTATDDPIGPRLGAVLALAVHNGELVDAGVSPPIRYTKTDELIKERPGWVNALAVYGGRLVDASFGQISYTETDEPIVAADATITALCPIPLSLAEDLAYRRGSR